MEYSEIAVIGAGTMGVGIAHVFALSHFKVQLVDVKEDLLIRALEKIRKNLERQVNKKLISRKQLGEAIKRIHLDTSVKSIKKSDIVVEAIIEDTQLKKKTFLEIDRLCSPNTIIASNTSSISITELASATKRPEKCIGMHFMNPVPIMPLVEIIRGFVTSDDTYTIIEDITKKIGKTPVEVKDFPGFISNRILMPMINEAIYCLMEGVAKKESIDQVMKLGMNHPMGPLALADFIGLDVCLSIMKILHDGFSDTKYRPCPLLQNMVAAGHLGRKSGKGFYSYDQ